MRIRNKNLSRMIYNERAQTSVVCVCTCVGGCASTWRVCARVCVCIMHNISNVLVLLCESLSVLTCNLSVNISINHDWKTFFHLIFPAEGMCRASTNSIKCKLSLMMVMLASSVVLMSAPPGSQSVWPAVPSLCPITSDRRPIFRRLSLRTSGAWRDGRRAWRGDVSTLPCLSPRKCHVRQNCTRKKKSQQAVFMVQERELVEGEWTSFGLGMA